VASHGHGRKGGQGGEEMSSKSLVRSLTPGQRTAVAGYELVRRQQPHENSGVPLVRAAGTKGSSDPSSGRTVPTYFLGKARRYDLTKSSEARRHA
jgi:hypothetical protein